MSVGFERFVNIPREREGCTYFQFKSLKPTSFKSPHFRKKGALWFRYKHLNYYPFKKYVESEFFFCLVSKRYVT